MKILFAAPDRDLLACYEQLLGTDFGEVVTAFDGTQVLSLLSQEPFDAAILDRDLPRVDHKTILARLREKEIPVVVLIDSPGRIRRISEDPSPDAYLSYPFTTSRLAEILRALPKKPSPSPTEPTSKKDETGV